jgi:SAM-dependent methyltransferase
MIDPTVSGFFSKNAAEGYAAQYRLDHGPRLKALLDRYGLVESLKSKRVVDVGGGLGFLGELLDPSTEYWVYDGSESAPEIRVSKGTWVRTDLDHDQFGGGPICGEDGAFADAAFCLEVLEHLGNPHHCLVEIKKLVKPDGEVYLSVPTESVWHNTPYPSLLWPPQNFAVFLRQMALPILDFYVYEPKGRGWPAYQFKCRNAPWREKELVFPKAEEKFRDCTPLEATNL